jgi:hypothetical protein
MDLGRWLRDRKKQLEGAKAQVNPFDNGQTYSTVVNNQRPGSNPFVDNRIKNAKYGVLANNQNAQNDFLNSVKANRPNLGVATWESLKQTPSSIANKLTDAVGVNKMVSNPEIERQQENLLRSTQQQAIADRIAGKITPEQARGRTLASAGGTSYDFNKDVVQNIAPRSSAQQAVLPALGSASKLYADGAGNLLSFGGTATKVLTPFDKQGENLQRAGREYSQGINDIYDASGFSPGNRPGENKVVTTLSSGVGSLAGAASMAAGGKVPLNAQSAKEGLFGPASAVFGLNAGGEQLRGSQASGKSDVQALGTGIASGVAEGLLEKFGLEKYFGATGGVIKKLAARMGTEGAQEFLQSITQSVARGTYSDVDAAQAIKQAAEEGIYGAVVGGIASAPMDLASNKNNRAEQSPVLQQTGIPAEPGSIRERIQQAKENVKSTIAENITPLNEGGYILLPSGKQVNDPLYHGTQAADKIRQEGFRVDGNQKNSRLLGDGVYMTSDKSRAEDVNYRGIDGEILDVTIPKDAKILEIPANGPGFAKAFEGFKTNKEVTDYYKSKGYDGIKSGTEIVLFDPKKAKVKQNKPKVSKDFGTEDDYVYHADATKAKIKPNNPVVNEKTKQDKIHQDDQKIMTDFIDHARGITKLTPEQAQDLEYNASLVAEGYGLKMPNSNSKLANVFSKELERGPVSNKVRGVARQSQLSKQSALTDNVKNEIPESDLMIRNYFENNPTKQGDATTGEGAKAPVQLDQNKKQSLLEKTRAAAKKLNQNIGDKGGATAGDIPGLGGILKKQEAKAKSKSPLTDQAYAETFGVSLEEAKRDVSTLDKTKAMPLDSVGMTEQEATKKLESNAPTMSPGNKKTKSLVDSMINDKKLTEAARIAQKEGKELNYFAKKDNNGRSVGIEEYNPSRQRIEAGFVVDNSTGKILGNHIKVDATGIQVNVGGEIVNMESIVGNPLDWTGNYKVSSTMERNIRDNAPTKEIADKTYKFVIANKIKSEANLKTDIQNERTALNERVKSVMDSKPKSVKESEYKADIFDYIEENKTKAEIASKYGPKATASINEYKTQTRKLYDSLLDRANKEFAKFGERQIPKRKDYITHINELNQQPSFAGEIMGQLQNSIMGEGQQTTRDAVPGSIAGRTETFTPRKRWNPFAQERKGGEFTKDPFKAVDSYLEPTLYNIHMTESAVRARAVESAFRTADQIRQSDASKVKTQLGSELAKYNKNTNNGKLISGFQEYANSLAGKTQRWDRQLIDASKATADGLKGWQGLQRIGGRATILGNVNSILMQPLNQVSTFADTGVSNYIKGVARSMGNSKAENLSPFIKARATKAESNFRTKGQKVMDAAGVPMQVVELASVKLAWNAEYEQVLSEGLKGQDAIIEADRRTERVVAGRGIADKPEVYRSTAANGLFQYTLEVSAQNKKFWKDFTPAQKGKFVAGAFAMNQLIGLVSGNEPLPDYLDAAIESLKDWFGDDDETTGEKAIQTGQRLLSETVKFNPFVSSAANLLPKETRKTVFGEDSELSRFEGVPAPIGVVQNAVDVGKNIAGGEVKKARDAALRLIPGGNQMRKTLQGKELIQDGAKLDKNGKVQYEAPESPLGKAQALLFGPSSTKNAREYYDSIGNKIAGALNKDSSGKTIDDFKTIAQASFGTEKGKEFMALTNDDQRKEFARASDENRGIYDQYKAMQKSFSGGDDLLPQGISQESEKVLNKYDRLVTGTKDKIFEREKGAEYEYNKASYERDLLDGKLSEVDKIRRQKYLAKDKIGAQYEKSIRDTYSLSKDQIKELVEGSKQGQKIYDQLVKYDQQLYDAGLIEYRKFKNGLSSGRGGRKSNGKSESYALESQTLKNLRRILDGTTFKGGAKVSTPKPGLAKQKKITVNTKA